MYFTVSRPKRQKDSRELKTKTSSAVQRITSVKEPTDHPERREEEVKQVDCARVLDVILEFPLQVTQTRACSTQHVSTIRGWGWWRWSYQLVEGVFELLQTVDKLVLTGRFRAQSQDALWWTKITQSNKLNQKVFIFNVMKVKKLLKRQQERWRCFSN